MKNLRTEVAYKAAMAELRHFIEKNELKPGDRLPTETELARTMGISRGTVREAIRALEALGVVQIKRGEGMFVQTFSLKTVLRNIPYGIVFNPQELLELLEVRKALECQFIQQTIRTLTSKKLAALRNCVEDMVFLVK